MSKSSYLSNLVSEFEPTLQIPRKMLDQPPNSRDKPLTLPETLTQPAENA